MAVSTSTIRPTRAWTIGGVLGAALVALLVLPGLVAGPSGHAAHVLFSAVCHQLPERSFALGAGPLALCHRCTGLLVGLVLAFLAAPVVLRSARGAGRRLLARVPPHHRAATALILAALPTTLDWALGASGLVANTAASRALTALLLGAVAGLLIADGLLRPASPSFTPTSSHAG